MKGRIMAKISAEDRRWMARNDVSTLVSAEEIKADSKRMSAAKAESKRQQKALGKVVKPTKKTVRRKGKKKR